MKKLIGLLIVFQLILWVGHVEGNTIVTPKKSFYAELISIVKYKFNCDAHLLEFTDLTRVCIYYKDGSSKGITCTKAQVQRIKNELQTFIDVRRKYVRQNQ